MPILKCVVGIDVSMETLETRFGTTDTDQHVILSPSKTFSNRLTGFK
jgi:hypothetical protein